MDYIGHFAPLKASLQLLKGTIVCGFEFVGPSMPASRTASDEGSMGAQRTDAALRVRVVVRVNCRFVRQKEANENLPRYQHIR
jgi:hypothetical protein